MKIFIIIIFIIIIILSMTLGMAEVMDIAPLCNSDTQRQISLTSFEILGNSYNKTI